MEYSGRATTRLPITGSSSGMKREIAPLLQRRWLFAESATSCSTTFLRTRFGGRERLCLLEPQRRRAGAGVYNNRYHTAHGAIHLSAAYADKGSAQLRRQRLMEGFG